MREGFIDHSDSLGATARFGRGDVQWLTAGAGIVHSEMFPLLKPDAGNRLELFQIWVNLPAKSKFAAPYFTMFWDKDVPRVRPAAGVEVTVVAGPLDRRGAARAAARLVGRESAKPTSRSGSITLEQGAKWTLPPAKGGTARTLYFFVGGKLEIEGRALTKHAAIEVAADRPVTLAAPGRQGRSAADARATDRRARGAIRPVRHEHARRASSKRSTTYQRTQFGGWPFRANDPVHPRERGRFAKHADGRVEDAPA